MVSNITKLDSRTKQHTQFGVSTSDGFQRYRGDKIVAEKKKKKNERGRNYIASPTGIANNNSNNNNNNKNNNNKNNNNKNNNNFMRLNFHQSTIFIGSRPTRTPNNQPNPRQNGISRHQFLFPSQDETVPSWTSISRLFCFILSSSPLTKSSKERTVNSSKCGSKTEGLWVFATKFETKKESTWLPSLSD